MVDSGVTAETYYSKKQYPNKSKIRQNHTQNLSSINPQDNAFKERTNNFDNWKNSNSGSTQSESFRENKLKRQRITVVDEKDLALSDDNLDYDMEIPDESIMINDPNKYQGVELRHPEPIINPD